MAHLQGLLAGLLKEVGGACGHQGAMPTGGGNATEQSVQGLIDGSIEGILQQFEESPWCNDAFSIPIREQERNQLESIRDVRALLAPSTVPKAACPTPSHLVATNVQRQCRWWAEQVVRETGPAAPPPACPRWMGEAQA